MNNEIIIKPENTVATSKESAEYQKDLEYAKGNMETLIETGMASTQELAQLAGQSQNSLFYERLSVMLKTVSDMNKDLVTVSKAKKDEKSGVNNPETPDGKVTNNLFVGSTADLQAMLKQMKTGQ